MTHLELVREASAIVPPAGASMAIAVVDDQLKHRAAFLVNGRIRSAPVGPAFDKPGAAIAFVKLLNGEDRPASRSSLDSDSAPRSGPASSRDEGRATSEVPESIADASVLDPAAIPPAAGVRTCEICQGLLPAGSRSHRRTDTDACRRALARRQADGGRVDAQGVTRAVPLSEPSTTPDRTASPVPTSPVAVGGYALPTATEDAGLDRDPGHPPAEETDLPTLGLT